MPNNGSDGSIIIDTELDQTGFEKGSAKLENGIKNLTNQIEKIGELARNGFSAAQVTSFNAKIENAQNTVAKLEEQLAELGEKTITTAAYEQLNKEMAKTEATLNRLYQRQGAMRDLGVSENSQQWKRLELQIQQAEDQLARYQDRIAEMERDGSAVIQGVDTAEYAELSEALDEAREKLAELSPEVGTLERFRSALGDIKEEITAVYKKEGFFAAAAETLRVTLANVIAPVQSLASALNKASDGLMRTGAELIATGTATGVLRGSLDVLAGMLIKVASAAINVAATLAKMVGMAVITALKKLASAAWEATKNIAKMAGRAITSGLDKLKSKLQSLTKSGKQTALTSNGLVKALTSVKTMLKSRVKRMFISYIMNEIKAAMSALVQFSSTFNASMSGMRNGATELGGNLAVTFSNIVNAVAPAITTIINLVSQATSYLNAFFAMLGGKSTVTVAKKQTEDYAKSLEGAAGAAKDLNKANKTLGIDELNVVSADDNSGGGSGSGAKDLYEEVAVDDLLPEDISGWFDRIKAAFENGDWAGIGSTIAEGLNFAVGKVDTWIDSKLRPAAVTWASRIAQALNGLVDGVSWEQVGATLGTGINTVFKTVNTFLATFNFEAAGVGLGNALNGLMDRVNWDLIGSTFGNKWNALIDTLYGFVSTVNWETMGSSISGAIMGWFNTIHWETLARTVSTGFNGVVDAISTFLTSTPWGEFATRLGTVVNTVFSNINWSKAGTTLTQGFNTAVRFFSTTLATIDWWAIGQDIADYLIGAIDAIDWKALGDLIGNSIIGLGALLIGFFSEIDWTDLGYNLVNGIGDAIKSVDWLGVLATLGTVAVSIVGGLVDLILGALAGIVDLIADAFSALGLDGIAGFLQGLAEGIKGVGTWIKENVIDPVVGWFKNLLGIHSPSTVFSEIGDFLIQGLLQGISNAWHTITEFFTGVVDGLKTALSTAWGHIKDTATTAWGNIKTAVTTKFTEAKNALSTTADNIKTTLSTAWENAKTTATTKWGDLKTAVTTKFTEAKTALSTTADNIKTTLSTTWDNIKSTAGTKWSNLKTTVGNLFTDLKTNLSTTADGIKSKISDAWDSVKTTATTKWTDLKTTVNDLWTGLKTKLGELDWKDIGGNLVSGIKQGISNAWSSFTSWVGDKFNSVTTTVKSAFGIKSPSKVFAEIGEYLDEGLIVGLKSGESGVLSTVKNLASTVTDTMGNASPELELSGNAAMGELDNVADTLMGIANSFSAIADALTAMGGLRVPAIAAGTVAPYQTRVDTESPSTGLEGLNNTIATGNADLLTALYELMEQVITAIRENGGNFYIGDEQIVRSYDRGDAARGVRVSRGAFADVY